MNESLVALVTGGNRGLGYEVCRQLAQLGYIPWLGSRDPDKGAVAAQRLSREGLTVVSCQLDVADPASIAELKNRISNEVGRLDTLVNNAAILYDSWQRASTADMDQVTQALATNTLGPWRMVQAFLPLLRKSKHPRIVNVSSTAGALGSLSGGTPAYSLSKAGLNVLTRMLAADLSNSRILINAVCPGWVATDMGGPGGRPVEDGARGIVWAVTLPDDGPTGGSFRDGKPISW